jgi:hypothetical protein
MRLVCTCADVTQCTRSSTRPTSSACVTTCPCCPAPSTTTHSPLCCSTFWACFHSSPAVSCGQHSGARDSRWARALLRPGGGPGGGVAGGGGGGGRPRNCIWSMAASCGQRSGAREASQARVLCASLGYGNLGCGGVWSTGEPGARGGVCASLQELFTNGCFMWPALRSKGLKVRQHQGGGGAHCAGSVGLERG